MSKISKVVIGYSRLVAGVPTQYENVRVERSEEITINEGDDVEKEITKAKKRIQKWIKSEVENLIGS